MNTRRLEREFACLVEHALTLPANEQAAACDSIDNLIQKIGQHAMQHLISSYNNNADEPLQVSLAAAGHDQILAHLAHHKINLDVQPSPLIRVIKLLVSEDITITNEHKAALQKTLTLLVDHVNLNAIEDGFNVLHYALYFDSQLIDTNNEEFSKPLAVFNLILNTIVRNHATPDERIPALAFRSSVQGFNIFEFALSINRHDALRNLMNIADYNQYCEPDQIKNSVNIEQLLSFSAICALQEMNHANELDKFRTILKSHITEKEPTFFWLNMMPPIKTVLAQSLADLFAGQPVKDRKDYAIKYIIGEIYTLLNRPLDCIPYLQYINDQLKQYYFAKTKRDFPALSPDSYRLTLMNQLHYPVPSDDNYIGFSKADKASALQECLMAILRTRGLANEAYKWVGFTPPELANPMVQNGSFITESRIGEGLFHGKLSHMLQLAIIVLAIDDGRIKLKYSNISLSLTDILSEMITARDVEEQILWDSVMDCANYLDNQIDFRSPHTLHSVIMHYGHDPEFNIPALSDYMIDTFCKGFIKLKQTYQALGCPHTLQEMVERYNDSSLATFHPFAIRFLMNEYRKRVHVPAETIYAENSSFFITKKTESEPIKEFKLQPYRLFSEKQKATSPVQSMPYPKIKR